MHGTNSITTSQGENSQMRANLAATFSLLLWKLRKTAAWLASHILLTRINSVGGVLRCALQAGSLQPSQNQHFGASVGSWLSGNSLYVMTDKTILLQRRHFSDLYAASERLSKSNSQIQTCEITEVKKNEKYPKFCHGHEGLDQR